jgi:hypothetical protein
MLQVPLHYRVQVVQLLSPMRQFMWGGGFNLSETAGPTGYIPGAWTCVGGSLAGSILVVVYSAIYTIINII